MQRVAEKGSWELDDLRPVFSSLAGANIRTAEVLESAVEHAGKRGAEGREARRKRVGSRARGSGRATESEGRGARVAARTRRPAARATGEGEGEDRGGGYAHWAGLTLAGRPPVTLMPLPGPVATL